LRAVLREKRSRRERRMTERTKPKGDLDQAESRRFYLKKMIRRAERILREHDRELKKYGLPKSQGARERFMSEHGRMLNLQRQALAQLAAEKRLAEGAELPAPFEVEGEGGGEEGE
jgi:hypothetical protein